MSDIATSRTDQPGWNIALEAVLCENCRWRFLVHPGNIQKNCPHCHQQALTPMPEGLPEMPYAYPPELIVPFSLGEPDLRAAIKQFSSGIPFAPVDLNPRALQQRLAQVFMPLWLVDSSIDASWQAEAGFDYQVISHQEQFNENAAIWQSREIKEDRIRWEKRAGRLSRTYQNVNAPALEEVLYLRESLGEFQINKALPYQPDHLSRAFVRLPDLPPQEAWKETIILFQKIAADECRQACSAGHLRHFLWKAEFSQVNWTLMLLPAYTSYYLDDDGQPQPVLIHGQNGSVTGARRASMHRAGRKSLSFLLFGIILFLSGLLLDRFTGSSFITVASTLISLVGIVFTVGSLTPYATAWDYNRKQALQSAEFRQY